MMFLRRLWHGNVEWLYPMRWMWERLTAAMLRSGYAEIHMRHVLFTEIDRHCGVRFDVTVRTDS